MLRIFSPEKSNGFGRKQTREHANHLTTEAAKHGDEVAGSLNCREVLYKLKNC
jgi:predicted deacylase